MRTAPGIVILLLAAHAAAEGPVESRLAAEIARIKAIDDHAHPMKVVGPGESDGDTDALALDTMEPFPFPVRLRPDNREWIGAWRALFDYRWDDLGEAHVATVEVARRRALTAHGDGYPAWVLDRIGIELYPEKVLFGTDAVALGPTVGWEECAWLSTTSARRALTMALAGMVRDGEIGFARAVELAKMVLHDNAARLYGP
jgi:hypothetical protein